MYVKISKPEIEAIYADLRLSRSTQSVLAHILLKLMSRPNNYDSSFTADLNTLMPGLSASSAYRHLLKLKNVGYVDYKTIGGRTKITYLPTDHVLAAFEAAPNRKGKKSIDKAAIIAKVREAQNARNK